MPYFPKKLLIISNRYPAGPDDVASPFVHDFHRALKSLDIEVDVVTPHYEPRGRNCDFIDGTVHRFEFSDGRRVISQMPRWAPSTYISLMRYFVNGRILGENLILRKAPDAILALWALPSGYIARRLSQRHGIPYAVWALGTDINIWAHRPVTGCLVKKVLDGADRLYADGYELAEKTEAIAKRPCLFIPSIHELHLDMKSEGTTEKSFVFVGRIEPSRGVFDLLAAFREFHKGHPDWKLHYIGNGQCEHSLRLAIAAMGLETAVIFHGYLERGKVNDLMLRAAAMIIPSHHDSLPLTFGEAMQAGLPVICSRVGDMPHYIDKYKVGYHFPAGDVVKLCDRMTKMAEHQTTHGRNCRGVVEEISPVISAREISGWLDYIRQGRVKEESGFVRTENKRG
jgi:glycosyltransferase involved in cell wall biosynthesis